MRVIQELVVSRSSSLYIVELGNLLAADREEYKLGLAIAVTRSSGTIVELPLCSRGLALGPFAGTWPPSPCALLKEKPRARRLL